MKKVTVLFTCFNRKKKTVECIKRLLSGNKDIVFNFIVVDDNSSDGTAKELSKIDSVNVIKGTGGLYYTGGMRLAIDQAKNSITEDIDYILLVNDDVYFYDNCIERLIAESLSKTDAIMVGALSDNDGNLSYSGIKELRKGPVYKKVFTNGENIQCDTFNANCVLIPRNVFLALDNMDKKYRHSLGDYDYGLQAKKRGFLMYTSSFYIGICADNAKVATWRDTSLSRIERIIKKESPKGSPFSEWFHFLYKNYGLCIAVYYSITPYIRILMGK